MEKAPLPIITFVRDNPSSCLFLPASFARSLVRNKSTITWIVSKPMKVLLLWLLALARTSVADKSWSSGLISAVATGGFSRSDLVNPEPQQLSTNDCKLWYFEFFSFVND